MKGRWIAAVNPRSNDGDRRAERESERESQKISIKVHFGRMKNNEFLLV